MFRDRDVVEARTSPLGYAMVTERGRYVAAPHVVILNEFLLDLLYGETKRGMVFMPPRHFKSSTVSRKFAGWFLGTYPDRRVGLMSYEADFARSWGRLVRRDIATHGDELFGVRVSKESAAADEWGIAGHEGGMSTAGIDGAFTGKGFHLFIVDDPIKGPKQAHSKAYRDAAFATFQSVVESRLEPGAVVVVVLTRWHEGDLAGRLLKEQPGDWNVLSLPALAEKNDPLGRPEGAALWPARYDEKALAKIAKRVGSYYFAAQFQQRPTPESGGKINRAWLGKFWSVLPKVDRLITSWDMAFKDTDDSSYVVGQAWGQRGGEVFLLDQVRARMDFPSTCRAFEAFHRKWKGATPKLVEDKANGPAVISTLRKKVPGILPVEVSGKGSKIARLAAVAPYFEAGNVYLPDPGVFSWVDEYVEEMVGFPNAPNDDQVDATSQALERLFGSGEVSLSGSAAEEKREAKKREREEERPTDPFSAGGIERIPLWRG